MELQYSFFINESKSLICKPGSPPAPSVLLSHFCKKIKEQQSKDSKLIKPINDLLDNYARSFAVVTNDEELKKNNAEKSSLCLKIKEDIHKIVIEKDAKFIDALSYLLTYDFNDRYTHSNV